MVHPPPPPPVFFKESNQSIFLIYPNPQYPAENKQQITVKQYKDYELVNVNYKNMIHLVYMRYYSVTDIFKYAALSFTFVFILQQNKVSKNKVF